MTVARPRLFSLDRPAATLLVTGARVLDPASGLDGRVLSIAVREGAIAELGPSLELAGAEVIDASGLTILPAFVDPHVHLRVPGQEYKEDVASGTRAAARGGYGAILAMPNTLPTIDSASVFDAVAEIAATEAVIPTGIVPAVSLGLAGEQLTEMGELADHGAAGFTDDGRPIRSAALLRRALQYARPLGLPVALHEEDPTLSAAGHMHEGAVSARLGIGGWPSIAESAMVARDLELAAFEDGRLHLQHLSARGSIEAVERAREAGVRVTSEATPHHLILTDEACSELDPATTKMNPPLGAEDDRQALLDAVRRGSVDTIATDHAPHARHEKEVPFEAAPFGVTGLETAFPALYTHLALPGVLPLPTIVERMTSGPARAFSLPVPTISVDAEASFSVWDLDAEWEVAADGFASKSANNAFLGERLRGVCLLTVAAGRVVHRDEERLADGTRFDGVVAAAAPVVVGEAVFTTSMTGYQEAMTDPSFARQLLAFTAPMIGNYGVEAAEAESDRIQAAALICREARNAAPAGRRGLLDWLEEAGVPAISGVDTRRLVRHLRDRGAMTAAVVCDDTPQAEAAARIEREPEMSGQNLAGEVSRPRRSFGVHEGSRARVTLIDYGAKDSIGRLLAEAGAEVTVLPHDADGAAVAATRPQGVLLANGPGDPGAMDEHVGRVREIVDLGVPVYGICLGHQLLARALGLETFKLRFGHRGANHPVLEEATGRVLVTSQNHGFAVAPPDDASDVVVTHVSLYDHTVEGLRLEGRDVWSMQFHPEAAPGPHDARDQLVRFVSVAAGEEH